MSKPVYYLSTPIYYPSGNWHLGHCYTTVICDAIARYKRMSGFDVFYLTGVDEHGQKIQKRAEEKGQTPQQLTDELAASILDLWKLLDISNDKFIRTTESYHREAVQKIFTTLYEKGDIYKSKYKGKYCVPCESYWTEAQLNDGKCPDCGRDVTDAEEESYFFRLSNYTDRIRALITSDGFLKPDSRVKEMVNNFLNEGLSDLAVTRTSVKWGIPVPFDPDHSIYVWIDALSNYITALGYGSKDDALFQKYWPCDLHMVGKEIVRFHTIIWPAILMGLGIEPPKKVFAHGWLTFAGDKMSKSKGNVVDPFILVERYGVDPIRYFLLREIPFGQDGLYSNEALLTRTNADIVNDLGNLQKRTIAMSLQYFGGKVKKGSEAGEGDTEFIAAINELYELVAKDMDGLAVNRALERIFALISRANKYIDENKPWELAKDPAKKEKLYTVIFNLLEALRVAATMLCPFLTRLPAMVFKGLGIAVPTDFKKARYDEKAKYATTETPALMPRIDIKKELAELDRLAAIADGATAAKTEEKKEPPKKESKVEKGADGEITIDQFAAVNLVVGLVKDCIKVEKSEKLLKLTVVVGETERTVVSGIAKYYTPEEMVGKSIVLVENLKPAKLLGIESKGMILCAEDGNGNLCLVTPEKAVLSGAKVR